MWLMVIEFTFPPSEFFASFIWVQRCRCGVFYLEDNDIKDQAGLRIPGLDVDWHFGAPNWNDSGHQTEVASATTAGGVRLVRVPIQGEVGHGIRARKANKDSLKTELSLSQLRWTFSHIFSHPWGTWWWRASSSQPAVPRWRLSKMAQVVVPAYCDRDLYELYVILYMPNININNYNEYKSHKWKNINTTVRMIFIIVLLIIKK